MHHLISFLRLITSSRIATLGAVFATSGFLANLILIIGELFLFESNPYMGIVSYLIFPGIITLGLLLVPIGIFLRIRSVGRGFALSVIDELAERRKVSVWAVLRVVFGLSMVNLVIFGIIGYRGFHYTESVEFCGQLCHEVMDPEFTAYSRSPHAQISCVRCHIGPGAGWFVKSKMSGARQVLAVAFDTYARPIETPVHNLRPAREVCEVCHRPDIFHGNLVRVIQHFEPDEQNTRNYTVLNMRVGGLGGEGQPAQGIHWHVSKDHEIRYYATDRKREKIVYIEQDLPDGTKRIWTRPDADFDPATIDPHDLRTMDCVDCHNRPTHIYEAPESAMDVRLSTGKLDPGIPWIRKLGEELLVRPYASAEEAEAGIAELPAIYAERYPKLYPENEEKLLAAVSVLQEVYRVNVFPQMKIEWNTYPSLIGHRSPHTAACFRCHDGALRDQANEPVTLDCQACHYVLATREEDPQILRVLQRQ